MLADGPDRPKGPVRSTQEPKTPQAMTHYTKAYRHRIYKKALKAFDERPDGLCLLLRDVNPDPEHYWYSETEHLFPELGDIIRRTHNGAGWSDTKTGDAARRRALLKCIELTNPTPKKP